jgi:Tfp pilus assembly protein PilF
MDRLAEALERLERAVAQLERALAAGRVPEPARLNEWKGEVRARLDGALETIARALGEG